MLGRAEMQQYEDERVRAELEKIQRESEELTRRMNNERYAAMLKYQPLTPTYGKDEK